MSRLYLIVLLLTPSLLFSQGNKLGKYLDVAKEQFQKGDYHYALEYYQKAMDIDSNSVAILWEVANTHRAYKDYRKAEYYFQKVYEKEMSNIYSSSLLQLGLMQKQNGKYEAAIETFKLAKRKYYNDKKSYNYIKSKQELKSCLWAKSFQSDSAEVEILPLPKTVNTKNSEFGHTIYDGQLIFSSLRADSIAENEEVYGTEYHTQLYRSPLEEGDFQTSEKIDALVRNQQNTGNGTFSLNGSRYYFSSCTSEGFQYRCKIMVAYYREGNWFRVDSLGEIINTPDANTTMPCIAQIEGNEVLFFASDRKNGEGGMDIYYSKISNGNQYKEPRPVKRINSIDNELAPYWDSTQNRLYFSSSWYEGFGGYDIFYSEHLDRFQEPKNAGLPYNSPANEVYFFKNSDTAYVTSNRLGVLYSKNPTCCSDIFEVKPSIIIEPPTPKETLKELNERLPVTLYFHNDRPNPDSWDTITNLNYYSTYEDYTARLDTYKKEYSKGLSGENAMEAKEDIESFFMEYVDQGVRDLELFRDLLLEELQNGVRVRIKIQGFASPLAKTDYNVHLTKRRISSLLNHLREYENGVFVPFLNGTAENGGEVIFEQVPFGEYSANQLTSDNPNDVQNSVYSRAAAIERKIEIQSVSYLDEKEPFPLEVDSPIFSAGVVQSGEKISHTFKISNTGTKLIHLKELEVECSCSSGKFKKATLAPGESTTVSMTFNSEGYMGHIVKSAYVITEEFEEKLEVMISAELR